MTNAQPSSGSGSSQSSSSSSSSSGSGSGSSKVWPAPKSTEIPRGSHAYVNEDFGDPTGAQDRVFLEGSAVVSRTDENGNKFEALTDNPAPGDVPIKVLERDFAEKAAERYAWNTGQGSSGSSGSGSGGTTVG